MYTTSAKKPTLILTIAFVILSSQLSFCQKDNSSDQFKWMTGIAKGDKGKGAFFESWKIKNESLLLGSGHYIVEGDTVFSETLRLQKIDKYWCYIPIINGNPPTLFVMIKSEANEVIFENKEHDFPQRIGYKITKNGQFVAWIEGTYNGEFSKEETVMEFIK